MNVALMLVHGAPAQIKKMFWRGGRKKLTARSAGKMFAEVLYLLNHRMCENISVGNLMVIQHIEM